MILKMLLLADRANDISKPIVFIPYNLIPS